MAEQMSTPRITAAYLDSFVGRTVTIVGKVTQLRGDQATIDADGVVTILLNRVWLFAISRDLIPTLTVSLSGLPPRKRQCRPDHWQSQPRPVHQGPQHA